MLYHTYNRIMKLTVESSKLIGKFYSENRERNCGAKYVKYRVEEQQYEASTTVKGVEKKSH